MAQVSIAQRDTPPIAALGSRAQGQAPRRGAILVVEDRDDVREGLAQLLELNGFVVFDVPDGEAALNYLRADPTGCALILLDLKLPGAISGQELRAQQLADDRLADIPAIVLSACEPDMLTFGRLRPAAWLEKPFRCEALLDRVHEFVTPECIDTRPDQ